MSIFVAIVFWFWAVVGSVNLLVGWAACLHMGGKRKDEGMPMLEKGLLVVCCLAVGVAYGLTR